jgi:two-component system, sensor histidine kinase LadS
LKATPDDPSSVIRAAVLLLLAVGILLNPVAHAAPVELTEDTTSVPLAVHVEVLEDPGREWSLSDVGTRRMAQRFAAVSSGEEINFGYSKSAYWLRFTLASRQAAASDWLLELAFPSLDRVEFYSPDGADYRRTVVGDRVPFAERPFPHRNFVFPLAVGAGEVRTFYLRITSSGTMTMPLRLWQPDSFSRHSENAYAGLSLYYGMLLALLLYNLLLYVSIRDRIYLVYVLFVASMAVGQLSFNGLGNQYVWPAWPAWGDVALPIGFAASGLFSALFVRGFLATARTAPGFDRLLQLLVVTFGFSALTTLLVSYQVGAILTSLSGLAGSVTVVATGVYCLRRGHPGARYFLLAWTLLMVGVGVTAMRNLNWLPTNLLTSYAMQVGSALEMLLLSFALADRINVLRREKEQAQADALEAKQATVDALRESERELEARVASRTRELEAANARLRASEAQLEARVASRTTELELARKAAEDANNAKSRFLAAASHDLRQPLTALVLYAKVLESHVAPSGRKLLDSMKDSIDSLSELLTDLLDLSKLEAGVVRPNSGDFSLADLLASLVAANAPEAEIKGLDLRCRALDLVVNTDVVLFRRILTNLLDNALRYTRRGGVLVSCRRRPGRVRVEVWDTGVGIPEDKTSEIFEEFRQLDDEARTRGSGLGLAIAAKSAALLGLEITVRSCRGRGSVFGIEVPLGKQVPAEAPPQPASPARGPLRIALVEDNVMLREALVAMLESLGYDVVAAGAGQELLAALAGRAPDMVVSDYRLRDGQTGFDVIKAVREEMGSGVPAILITGDTDPALVRNMAERGIVVLHKPLDLAALETYIEDLRHANSAATTNVSRLDAVQ